MKTFLKKGLVMMCVPVLFMGCAAQNTTEGKETETAEKKVFEEATAIELSDSGILVDGKEISESDESDIYIAKDIVFYLEGQGITYGEGTLDDEHSKEEADTHTVLHITKPGTYALSGSLSRGQIAIDLGEEAEDDPEAVVTLILNGVDIECTVAPAIIFYNVYECGSSDTETATNVVDTTAAGANVLIADGSVNNIKGSYVARIYKPDSVILSEDGTEVVEEKKLHKYDGAFYSKMSMNINGDEEETGILNITAENEGLDSELHLTINGGNINITSGNDGINTNEDEVSVTTINGGNLTIKVTGETGEGDGIDSNGWLVINGGTIIAEACSSSADAGIDTDMGIHINGGTVMATGNMLDRISESNQNYAVFSFAERQSGGIVYTLKNEAGEEVITYESENDFSYLILSSPELTAGTYTLWQGETQLAASAGESMMGGMGMHAPQDGNGGFEGERPEDMKKPEEMEKPEEGEMPKDMTPPDGTELPEGMEKPEGMERPDGGRRGDGGEEFFNVAEASKEIEITDGGNYFNSVKTAE